MSVKESFRTWKSAALAVGVAAGITLLAPTAQASVLFFNLTSSTFDASWYQSVPADVAGFRATRNQVVALDGNDSVGGTFTSVGYYTSGYLGFSDSTSANYLFLATGPIFSGPTSAPVFTPTAPGSPILLDGGAESLTITAVPEPASWALMLAGFGAIGFMARRRRNVTVAYA